MTNVIDLTTVGAVNAILGQDSGVDAALIQTEITAYSQNILTRTSRSFLSGIRITASRYNGNGCTNCRFATTPSGFSISRRADWRIAIPASPDYIQCGYAIDTEDRSAAICTRGEWEWQVKMPSNDRWGVIPGGWGSFGNAPPLGQAPYRFVQGSRMSRFNHGGLYHRCAL